MRKLFVLLVMMLGLNATASADLKVFACEPEWAALARELGGDKLHISTATTALQDPHHVQARPSLIARLRKADLLVCTGADLEVGWLPVLLRRASNAGVQPGQPGYLEAASVVALRDRPARLDRAQGDVHPQGNPHIQTDPHNILKVAKMLGQRLIQLDAENTAFYQQRIAGFSKHWNEALAGWDKWGEKLRGMPIVVQHNGWTYLVHWLGLKQVATLEPKPGVPPSSADLSQACLRPRDRFCGTSQSPKSTRPLTTYWCPSRPGHQALRNNFASSLLLRTCLPMTGRRVWMPTLLPLWRYAHDG